MSEQDERVRSTYLLCWEETTQEEARVVSELV